MKKGREAAEAEEKQRREAERVEKEGEAVEDKLRQEGEMKKWGEDEEKEKERRNNAYRAVADAAREEEEKRKKLKVEEDKGKTKLVRRDPDVTILDVDMEDQERTTMDTDDVDYDMVYDWTNAEEKFMSDALKNIKVKMVKGVFRSIQRENMRVMDPLWWNTCAILHGECYEMAMGFNSVKEVCPILESRYKGLYVLPTLSRRLDSLFTITGEHLLRFMPEEQLEDTGLQALMELILSKTTSSTWCCVNTLEWWRPDPSSAEDPVFASSSSKGTEEDNEVQRWKVTWKNKSLSFTDWHADKDRTKRNFLFPLHLKKRTYLYLLMYTII